MRIILLGPPGSGKGTQSFFLSKKYNIPHISTGDILRTVIESNLRLKKQIKNFLEKGKLISDEIIFKLIKDRIFQKDCCNGFILDGFPRTISQIRFMKEKKINIDYILEFNIPDSLIFNRIEGRYVHPASGRIYHVKYNPPITEGKDDITGEDLIPRKDDRKEIIQKRLLEYRNMIIPIRNYYNKESKLGNLKYIKVNSGKSIFNIRKELENFLNKFQRKKLSFSKDK